MPPRVRLVAVGGRSPDWISIGFEEYRKRLGSRLPLELVDIDIGRRGRSMSAGQRRAFEAGQIRRQIGGDALVVALDVAGRALDTVELAAQIDAWRGSGRDMALLIGGPDGLDPQLVAEADACWSLSRLTFPHMLVRVVLAEQLYRAMSILDGHPYHR